MPYSAIGIFVLPILAYHMRIVRMTLGHIYNARDTGYRIQNELEPDANNFQFPSKDISLSMAQYGGYAT